jgi:hypothetical protein
MDREKMSVAVSALRGLFNDDEIPNGFTHASQTFDERCEARLLHAVERLEEEIEAFEGGE